LSRIYVVEDDESISALIAAVLGAAGHEVRTMESGAPLEQLVAAGETPDLLLLDIMLPGKDGLTLLREWKARPSTSAIPCIILSAKGDELDKVRGLELGAEDYVTKPFGVLELQARVKTALRRVPAASGNVRLGGNEIDFSRREVWRDGREIKLTFKEFELLEYMYKNAGLVLSRDQLLTQVWGYNFEGDTTRTVDFHIHSLRQKLGDSAERPHFIQTVRGYGYKLSKGED
jgi:two-component system alkaline phosphatase synthesis response regulator PhoP